MQFARSLALTAIAALMVSTLLPNVDAHQRVIVPAPKYTIADRGTNWSPIAYMERQYKTGPDLLGFIKSKGAKTLRDFMDNKSLYKLVDNPAVNFECGWTDPKGKRQPIPANGMMRSSGYTHEGPCEIWLDNVKVLAGDNCNKDVGAGKTSYKIDWSSCKGECMLRWYWFGNRNRGNSYSWQVYKACVPMKGNGGGNAAIAKEADVPSGNSTSCGTVGKDTSGA